MPSERATRERPIVQTRNPRVNRYVKIDRQEGRILEHREEEGPYPGIPIARRSPREETQAP